MINDDRLNFQIFRNFYFMCMLSVKIEFPSCFLFSNFINSLHEGNHLFVLNIDHSAYLENLISSQPIRYIRLISSVTHCCTMYPSQHPSVNTCCQCCSVSRIFLLFVNLPVITQSILFLSHCTRIIVYVLIRHVHSHSYHHPSLTQSFTAVSKLCLSENSNRFKCSIVILTVLALS